MTVTIALWQAADGVLAACLLGCSGTTVGAVDGEDLELELFRVRALFGHPHAYCAISACACFKNAFAYMCDGVLKSASSIALSEPCAHMKSIEGWWGWSVGLIWWGWHGAAHGADACLGHRTDRNRTLELESCIIART